MDVSIQRSSGVLLHPTSLPGPHGIGDLGTSAYAFADLLIDSGQRYWQVLPLGPTGYGDSPYQSFSAFAGNPLLISPEKLHEAGLISDADLKQCPTFPEGKVHFEEVIPWKRGLLKHAYENFLSRASDEGLAQYDAFCAEMAHWLDDYAMFMAMKDGHNGKVWTEWDSGLASRDNRVIELVVREMGHAMSEYKFAQFQFYKQWWELRHYCGERGLHLIGDVPIYASHDSVDVWANPEKFQLDENGMPTHVAGVPPDYFSETGQLWGNPVYRWEAHAADNFGWWVSRIAAQLRLVDIVRIDHFRGFEAYWRVPAEEETAIEGEWLPGPRDALFEAFRNAFGDELPIIAENLGIITDEVEALRERFGMSGMAVFQFGFGNDAESSALPPFKFTRDMVAYSGTHDNDTTVSWWKDLKANDKPTLDYIKKYFDTNGRDIHWTAIQAMMASVADLAITPVQDILGLDNSARMNHPGTTEGNWSWRMKPAELQNAKPFNRLHELTERYGRSVKDTSVS